MTEATGATGGARKAAASYMVAEEAGVSQSAVSRAYKSGGSVSKATREKIYAAGQKLGYRPNAIARSLISKQSNMIGIVMADITNPFYSSVLEVFLQKLQAEGQKAIVLVATRDQDVDDLLPQLLEYQVDGLVVTSATLSSEMGRTLSDMGVPVVMFNRSVPDSHSTSICCDNNSAGRQVAQLFFDRGMRNVAYIAGIENTSTNQDRRAGFLKRSKELGLSVTGQVQGFYTYDGGYQAALALCASQAPEAIFCANDIMAMGAMDALRYELKLSIPEQVSVMGFDDINSAHWPVYDLTTFRMPIERMVTRSIENLLVNKQRENRVLATETLAVELVLRGSVRSV